MKLIQFISRIFSILCTYSYIHAYEIFILIILIRSKSNVYGQSVFFSCFKTLTRRSWHPSEWPIFDTKTFVSNFAASTVITNLLPGQKKLRNYSHKSLLAAAAAEYFVDHLKRCGVAFFQTS